jgi:uncharacterized protein YbjT (DUF2867 family)
MKILVTGASGFTGSYVVPALLGAGWDVVCFVRESSDLSFLPVDQIVLRYGDLDAPDSLSAALKGIDILVSVSSLGTGHADSILRAASASGVNRGVFFSTTSIYTTLNPASKAIRLEAERAIQGSGIPYTIIRPTMIYGNSRDRNVCNFIQFVRKSPVFPVFGRGDYEMQPVYVGDLAEAVTSILLTDRTIDQAYNLSGGSRLSLIGFITQIAESLDKRIRFIHLPPGPFIWLLSILERTPLRLPIKSEQIQRFNEHKVFSHRNATRDFGYSPLDFSEGLKIELKEMGLIDD